MRPFLGLIALLVACEPGGTVVVVETGGDGGSGVGVGGDGEGEGTDPIDVEGEVDPDPEIDPEEDPEEDPEKEEEEEEEEPEDPWAAFEGEYEGRFQLTVTVDGLWPWVEHCDGPAWIVVEGDEDPQIYGEAECNIPVMLLEVDSEITGTLTGAPDVQGNVHSTTFTESLNDPWTGEFSQPGVFEAWFSGGYSFGGWGSGDDVTYEGHFIMER